MNIKKKTAKSITEKIIIFSLGDLYLGLKLDGIKKVISIPEIFKSGDKLIGVTQFDDEEVVVLDLYQKIYGTPADKSKAYLIIIQDNEKLFGITIPTLPMIKEIDQKSIQPVPQDYRERDSLGIADQIGKIALDKEKMITVFLIKVTELLEVLAPAKTA